MRADELVAHFERMSEAPGAVVRLRELIVRLAVRGKLVPQDPADGCADAALAKAREWLEERAADTARLRWKRSEPVELDETPAEVPVGWVAARVNDTGFYINGLAFKPSDWGATGRPIIRIQNLTDSSKPFNYSAGNHPDEVIVRDGDILVSWSATLDAFVWNRGEGLLNQHIFRVVPAKGLVDPRYLYLLLRSAIRDMAESDHAHGLVMTHINRGPFLAHVVAIPPRSEQRRIVAKVDELMALCDRLEAAQTERERRRDRLIASSLHRLNQPTDDADVFRDHARFHFRHLPRLTTRPQHVLQLRQTILNLAVRGWIVPQVDSDEPAAQFLGARLLTPPRPAWTLPSGWAWSSLARIGAVIGGGTPSKTEDKYWDGTIPWVSPKDMKAPRIRDAQDRITEEAIDNSSTRLIPSGALLMVVRGMILAHSFPTAIAEVPVTINQDMKAVVPFVPELAPMLLLITHGMKPVFLRLVQRSTHGTCKLLTDDVLGLPIPIPPLAEQPRILAKVAELMVLCDRLEAQIIAGRDVSRSLLEAVLHRALEPVQQDAAQPAEVEHVA